ncbi:hypothetical protein RCH21_002979 [Arthrobacter sp. PL16]|uniref:hypothetical protein n=1 Tax=Arthrobacter sp. PL16 TaxID=3071720 RepID=UPI002DFDFE39|nr:hypothetical protein [Arthrobacter sp. PL16]
MSMRHLDPPDPAPLPAPPSRRSPGRVTTVTLLLALLLGLAGMAPAAAGPVSGGWHTGAGVVGTGYFVGQHRNAEGLIAYCTDFERFSPDRASGYGDGNTGPFVRSDGSALSTEDNAILAFVLGRWGATADDDEAAAVQLAVWSLTAVGMGWDTPAMTGFILEQGLTPDLALRARSMVDEARTGAGPYSISAAFVPEESHGEVRTAVLAADGTTRAGHKLRAVVDGATFADGTTTAEWTSNTEQQVLELRRTGFGTARVTITAPAVPAANAAWLAPREADVQRLVVAPLTAEVAASVDLPASMGFTPAVITATSTARTSPGTPVLDVLEVSAAGPEPWLVDPSSDTPVALDVVSTLWGPLQSAPSEGAGVPDGTPSLGTVTTAVSGPGRYETPSLVVGTAGYYVWTESIDPKTARPATAASLIAPWSGRFGLAAETTLVPWEPSLSTRLSHSSALPGAVLQDTVTGDGFSPPDDGSLVRLTMFGPLSEPPVESPEVPAEATVHSIITVPATNGVTISGNFAPLQQPGCYTVVASFEGSDEEMPFTSSFGIPAETVCVDAQPLPPKAAEPPAAPVPSAATPAEPSPPPAAVIAQPHLAATGIRATAAAGAGLMIVGIGMGLRLLTRRRNTG